eukprot:CAMPEP_0194741150 /NCGR_PEP_ID=MMETSP0296-20130528/95202_1 /TAXON_ID=39354 /ORGANISM="Heterosigma akashiwo, Strain CCMP2393" /LENGTH=38 /DNA_ID= /DNA_START= /DNA_END= /DNA_ORIENTATION=
MVLFFQEEVLQGAAVRHVQALGPPRAPVVGDEQEAVRR